ncbi:helix-turn-helix domain-containing protein [uncultured Chitinophaga sp.]|jgi:Predicted transcriptional regulators|uniref:winged helix-turn-helix transcriptional regulator n=1 Tax=uncultured Chitinophaga sp. TaxID=339340 RepID=UPI0026151491|nr:helix-turn-helix domain-containing protein [uncultured Chitinophaga sp.]
MEPITKRLEADKRCPTEYVLAIHDTMNVLSGKWKLRVLAAILKGSRRFTEIQRRIPGITPRMLSKELKDLEMNGMIKRMVDNNTFPVTVEYELSPAGDSLAEVLDVMVAWGLKHRKEMMGESSAMVHS